MSLTAGLILFLQNIMLKGELLLESWLLEVVFPYRRSSSAGGKNGSSGRSGKLACVLPSKKMIWGERFDVCGVFWYCCNRSCIHEVLNFTKKCVESVVAECQVSNYCVECVFDRSI